MSPSNVDRQRREARALRESGALLRLHDKTQVDRGPRLSTRYTHTLRVAQVVSRIFESLRRKQPREVADLDLFDALLASWIHDIGHPPFGHSGEATLNDLAREYGLPEGFEGNPQNIRVLKHITRLTGVPFSIATVAAQAKYPSLHGERPGEKFGFYRAESQLLREVRSQKSTGIAAVVDLGDGLAYALDDFGEWVRCRRIPIHRFVTPNRCALTDDALAFLHRLNKRLPSLCPSPREGEGALLNVLKIFPLDVPCSTLKHELQLSQYLRFAEESFVSSIELVTGPSGPTVTLPDNRRLELDLLKQLLWDYVILAEPLQAKRRRQQTAMRRVASRVIEASLSKRGRDFESLPLEVRAEIERAETLEEALRAALDYVSWMTESELALVS